MRNQRTVYTKQVSFDTVDNPLETTVDWIVKVVEGIKTKRTAPLSRRKLQEFFPMTSGQLFFKAFNKAIDDNLIQKKLISYRMGYGYIVKGE